MSLNRSRPSPAMLVAALALTFALVGTALAAPDASLVDLSKSQVKRIAKKQTNKAISARESSLNVNSAKSADSANNANSANNAQNLGGSPASAFQRTARWALVQPNGTIAAQSGGITVTKGGAGFYGVDFGVATAGKAILATSGLANDINFRGVVSAAPCTGGTPEAYGGQACPGGNSPTKVEVFTDNPGETATQDHSFYITLLP